MSTTEATFEAADDDEFSDAYVVDDSARRRPNWITTRAIPLLVLVVAIYLQIALAIDARVLGAIPNFALVVLVAFALRFGRAMRRCRRGTARGRDIPAWKGTRAREFQA